MCFCRAKSGSHYQPYCPFHCPFYSSFFYNSIAHFNCFTSDIHDRYCKCINRPSWFVSTLQFLLAKTHFVPVVIVSVPFEYQSVPSVVVVAGVKHNMSE